MITLSGKSVLITGGSSGIGLATARLLAKQGVRCALLARDAERLAGALSSLEAGQRPHLAETVDISDALAVNQVVERLQAQMGTPDILINCAGAAHPGYVQDLPPEIFHQMMNVNYYGAVNLTKAILPGMLGRGSGHIVNVSSIAGFAGIFGYSAYGASKFALRGFSDALRHEMKPHGIRVSIVYPPDTDTPQLAYENQYKPPELKLLLPELGMLTPEQVARSIVNGIQHGREVILPDFGTRALYILNNLLGAKVYVILDFLLQRARNKISRSTSNHGTEISE